MHGEPLLDHERGNLQYEDSEKRYCCNKLTKKWYYAVWALSVIIVLTVLVVVLIFVVGRSIAQTQLNDSAIIITMTISNPTANSFDVHVMGTVDNRGSITATLEETSINLEYPTGSTVGYMDFPSITADGGSVTPLDVRSTVYVSDQSSLTSFATDLLHEKTIYLQMTGKISAKAMGITFKDLDFSKKVALVGFNDLQTPPPVLLSQKVVEGQSDRLKLMLQAQLYNPSSVSFTDVGMLNLTVLYKDVVVGFAEAEQSVSLYTGVNVINMTCYVVRTDGSNNSTDNRELIVEIFSSYVSGETVTMTLQGNDHTSDVALLNPSLATLSTNVDFPGLIHGEDKLFRLAYEFINLTHLETDVDATCAERWSFPSAALLPVTGFVYNPLDAALVVDTANLNVSFLGYASGPSGEFVDTYVWLGNAQNTNMNLLLNAKSVVAFSQPLCTTNLAGLQGLTTYVLVTVSRGTPIDWCGIVPFPLAVDVEGAISGHLGNFSVELTYRQTGVTGVARIYNPYVCGQ